MAALGGAAESRDKGGSPCLQPSTMLLASLSVAASLYPQGSCQNGPIQIISFGTKSKEKALKEASAELVNYATMGQANKLS